MKPTRRTQGHGYCQGGARLAEYDSWSAASQRCRNPRHQLYAYYGGRGITVCDRWRERDGFANFLADVGRRPGPGFSLHRIDNDGPYAPGNVVWADRKTQARHRRSNRRLTFQGQTRTVAGWAEVLGIKLTTLKQRLYKGWPPAKALAQPVEHRRPFAEWRRRKANRAKPGPKPRRKSAR